jgi:hypothetical protein
VAAGAIGGRAAASFVSSNSSSLHVFVVSLCPFLFCVLRVFLLPQFRNISRSVPRRPLRCLYQKEKRNRQLESSCL